jgi:AhpD family alkylhydroperoxidase
MGTASTKAEILREIEQTLGRVPQWARKLPDEALGSFWSGMRDLQLGETRIPGKYKELIGLAVSGATRCRYCQLFHAEAARLNGASEEEINEAAAMSGFTMMTSTFLNAVGVDYEQFKDELHEIMKYVKDQAGKRGGRPGAKPH